MFHLTNGCFETKDLAGHPSWVLGHWMSLVPGTFRHIEALCCLSGPWNDHRRKSMGFLPPPGEIWWSKSNALKPVMPITSICFNFFPESCYPVLRLELRKYHLSIVQVIQFHTTLRWYFLQMPPVFSTFKAGHTRLVQRVGAEAKPWAEDGEEGWRLVDMLISIRETRFRNIWNHLETWLRDVRRVFWHVSCLRFNLLGRRWCAKQGVCWTATNLAPGKRLAVLIPKGRSDKSVESKDNSIQFHIDVRWQ